MWAASRYKQNGDVTLWRQGYIPVFCQLFRCPGFCSLSLRHQLGFWPKKAKGHGVAVPRGEKRDRQATVEEAHRRVLRQLPRVAGRQRGRLPPLMFTEILKTLKIKRRISNSSHANTERVAATISEEILLCFLGSHTDADNGRMPELMLSRTEYHEHSASALITCLPIHLKWLHFVQKLI